MIRRTLRFTTLFIKYFLLSKNRLNLQSKKALKAVRLAKITQRYKYEIKPHLSHHRQNSQKEYTGILFRMSETCAWSPATTTWTI